MKSALKISIFALALSLLPSIIAIEPAKAALVTSGLELNLDASVRVVTTAQHGLINQVAGSMQRKLTPQPITPPMDHLLLTAQTNISIWEM